MSAIRHFILATAGHVDHGKSTLIQALTGTDPDRLPEEQLRGITIDLGFAHLEIPDPANPSSSLVLGIVDVPGHEDFVKNMVAGVGSIDLALLVVAADDGWMPQTEEHLQILTYLGVSRAVVALTKIDLVEDEKSAAGAIREKLHDTPFSDAPIVATSVASGRGLDELKSALSHVLADAPPQADIGKPRLPVDRVFKLQGIGTVVTGTLNGGTLRRGQTVAIQPSGKTARIRNIQSHGRDVEVSGPGSRTALNLSLDTVEDTHRGDVITLNDFGGPSPVLDVRIEISARAIHAIKDGARVHAHHGSGSVAARVAFHQAMPLAAGENAVAQLRLEAPVFAFAGDRFIIRDWAERITLGGAIVLDPGGDRREYRREARMQFLRARAQAPGELSRLIASQALYEGATRKSQLLLQSRFSGAAISAAASQLGAAGTVVLAGDFVVDAARWQALHRRATEAIEARHRTHPEQSGLPLTDLRAALQDELPVAGLFDAVVAELCTRDFVRVGTAIRRTSHLPALPPQLQAAGARVRAMLATKPMDPPSRKDLAPDVASQQALRFLIQTGEVVEINAEIVMSVDSMKHASEMIRQFIRAKGPATTSDLRQMLGNSRRVAIPLLERLDRDGVTLRQGDKRSLRS
ncbi:MAG TPA: selenocysteine-specific translation elongation factor [Candidatus Acidoferrales bacterium]|jgi:selenocysteine-specific elongation factor|nr:selenocysteine-specific translation elongation factor [Candidatus Acidoferrales bacterium]